MSWSRIPKFYCSQIVTIRISHFQEQHDFYFFYPVIPFSPQKLTFFAYLSNTISMDVQMFDTSPLANGSPVLHESRVTCAVYKYSGGTQKHHHAGFNQTTPPAEQPERNGNSLDKSAGSRLLHLNVLQAWCLKKHDHWSIHFNMFCAWCSNWAQ